jgi:hypothetical protein
MDKYLIITDNSGQKHSIDLTRIGAFAFTTTTLSVRYTTTVGEDAVAIQVNHATAPTSYAFKDWFIGEMERIMSSNWREVADEPTPPYAVSTLSKLVVT